jgi:hypothetical protein
MKFLQSRLKAGLSHVKEVSLCLYLVFTIRERGRFLKVQPVTLNGKSDYKLFRAALLQTQK